MAGAGGTVFAVWAYILAHADRDGSVELNPRMVSASIGDDPSQVVSAIKYLSSPDPDSRTENEEGRRIVKTGQFVYEIVNYLEYATLRSSDEIRENNRRKQAEYRARARARALGRAGYPEPEMSIDVSSRIKIKDLRLKIKNEEKEKNTDMSSSEKIEPPAEVKTPKQPKQPKTAEGIAKVAELKKSTDTVFEYWKSMMDKPKSSLTALRKQRIHAILSATEGGKPKYTIQDVIVAINGCKRSPHHMGDNDQHTAYNDIELICRNETKFEKFMEMGDKPVETRSYARNSNSKPSSGAIIANRPWRRQSGGEG